MRLLSKAAELPRFGLWKVRVKMGEKRGVSEVPGARTDVSHQIGAARDVVVECGVAVVALV